MHAAAGVADAISRAKEMLPLWAPFFFFFFPSPVSSTPSIVAASKMHAP